MKHLRTFEDNDMVDISFPDIGDYVVCDFIIDGPIKFDSYDELKEFLDNNIGEIIDKKFERGMTVYLTNYNDIPNSLQIFFTTIEEFENIIQKGTVKLNGTRHIVIYSKDKNVCKTYLQSKIYNL